MRLNFVYRHNLRYMARAMNERAGLVRAYSDQNVSQATGDQAELWSNYIFRANSFSIVGRHTREYQGNEWNQTEHDLDFIIEKDGVAYGVEVKNTFPYIEDDLLDTKLNICAQLGIIPLFVFRQAPLRQMEKVKNQGGIILILRTKVFPLGYERLVKSIWETMRLPVSIWRDFPPKIDKVLQKYHQTVTEQ